MMSSICQAITFLYSQTKLVLKYTAALKSMHPFLIITTVLYNYFALALDFMLLFAVITLTAIIIPASSHVLYYIPLCKQLSCVPSIMELVQ